MNASEISCASHQFIGWRLAGEEEEIPYAAILVARREPSIAESQQASELERIAEAVLAGK
jgi:hypothetical protein